MASGIHSTISLLQTRLFLRWCPKWYGAFSDHVVGGFFERLGKGFKPVYTGQRRLVTQCRQLSIYSEVSLNQNNGLYKYLKEQFEFIAGKYHDPETGLWIFSLDDVGAIKDQECDLYALTFVIFSFSHYYRATQDERAKIAARSVLDLIDSRFRLQVGLAEAIWMDYSAIPKLRRQNPHMHLLEACLFAHETWNDPAYEAMADEMVSLFYGKFYDPARNALVEFFTDDLLPHPDKGDLLEPGHYFEWVWLLKKHAAMKGDDTLHNETALQLLTWANANGWDSVHGGIYDVVSSSGQVMSDTKRIWPFCEALKANALMLTLAPDRQAIKDRVADMVQVFQNKYMQERGFWTELLNRDLSAVTDFMPGTTPYHVYFGITETMDVLNARGGGKSLSAGLEARLYAFKRFLSNTVRGSRRIWGG